MIYIIISCNRKFTATQKLRPTNTCRTYCPGVLVHLITITPASPVNQTRTSAIPVLTTQTPAIRPYRTHCPTLTLPAAVSLRCPRRPPHIPTSKEVHPLTTLYKTRPKAPRCLPTRRRRQQNYKNPWANTHRNL